MGKEAIDQLKLLAALRGMRAGDFNVRLPLDWTGVPGRIADVFNEVAELNLRLTCELERMSRTGGRESRSEQRASLDHAPGSWGTAINAINVLVADFKAQLRDLTVMATDRDLVLNAVARGDLSKRVALDVDGRPLEGAFLRSGQVVNSMIQTLATFADQVATVAREVGTEGKLGRQAEVPGADGSWKKVTDSVNSMAANLTAQVRAIGEVSMAVTRGDLSRSINVDAQGEIGQLKDTINEMISNLRETTRKSTQQDWLKTSLARFTRALQGERNLHTVGNIVLSELAVLVKAQHGVMYVNRLRDGQPTLELVATYAYRERKELKQSFGLGEGLVGQCAYEKTRILLTDVPAGYVRISSGLGAAPPLNIVVLPVLFEGDVRAVIELASFECFDDMHLAFLDQLTESVGVVMNTISATARTEELLTESQALSAERLQTNDQLEEKARLLSAQNAAVERQKQAMDVASAALEQKAEQLALTSKYKSQFLANMSHELRTPLNSMLILSEQLSDNVEKNLSPKQVEYATTILGAGNDLLSLINDILDLSKIESGMMRAEIEDVSLEEVAADIRQTFEPVARAKGLAFSFNLDRSLPKLMRTDSARLQQVLKNLLSNAFKFTQRGSVTLAVDLATAGWSSEAAETLGRAERVIGFACSDTGIGIAPDKQAIVFEAFQQADMTTSRRFGGTGLGLSISREIASALGGEISVASQPGEGSCFTLYLPLGIRPSVPPVVADPQPAHTQSHQASEDVVDDRELINANDRVLLIVDDDPRFTRTLLNTAHDRGFKALIALRGATALTLARKFKPAAVTLDIELPDQDGWKVLDALKHDPATRHIPVHVISVDDQLQKALELGAVAGLTKPVSTKSLGQAFDLLERFIDQPIKNLLVVESNVGDRDMMVELIGDGDVVTTTVASGEEGLAALDQQKFDCVVIDVDLPDMSGFELIERIKQSARVPAPILVYSSKDFTVDEENRIRELSETVTVKDVRSPERLLDQTALFLHRSEARLPEAKRKLLEKFRRSSPSIVGKKVLIVDDDMRNIFALTSVLERQKLNVLNAESGAEAIDQLHATPDIDIVLMDIMMPEMDGFEAMRKIRADPAFDGLPIIAVTAKAMKTDRQECIQAGASDYISKPIDTAHLVSLLRVWLTHR